jgi:transcriptional regulator with XRE-family HTH domain
MQSDTALTSAADERRELAQLFGTRIRFHRLVAEMSTSELAKRCRLSPNTVARTERGRSEPRLSRILILCDGLGTSPGDVLGDLPVPQKRDRRDR